MSPASRKRWLLREADRQTVIQQAEQLKVSPLLARILVLRGYIDGQSAKRFLSSSLREDLPSPFEMVDMEVAVSRLVKAIEDKEYIGIWGDYDVDGTTGASVLVCFLRAVGAQPFYYVPHRIDEGYGLNVAGLRRMKDRGVGLVITVDCGISNGREIEAAREFGLDIIVIDHHQPPPELPRALAVVNPHRRDCPFPDKGLCAAGLAFYVVIALRAKLREAGWFSNGALDIRPYLDIVTLGTIADMVPLKGVNRTLLRRGLQELSASNRPGVVALKKVAGVPAGIVSAGQVGFRLGPRINAAGRVDYGIKVVELLTTESNEVALRIAQELEAHNSERRAVEAAVLEQALASAAAAMDGGDCHSLVLAGDGWHAGVLGIVASRIVEKYCRPTVVIGFDGDQGKGSARSIRGFHLVRGFEQCAEHLEKFGGHEYAGGLSIKAGKLERFAEAFEAVARQTLMAEDLLPVLEVDAELKLSEISLPLLAELDVLKPFGVGNPEPLFMTTGAEICERKTFSSGVRYRLRQAGRALSGVIFGAPDEIAGVPGQLVDVAYRLTQNDWNGTSSAELRIADLKTSGSVWTLESSNTLADPRT
jgi:single-stranded-DNA-specific exonuclease